MPRRLHFGGSPKMYRRFKAAVASNANVIPANPVALAAAMNSIRPNTVYAIYETGIEQDFAAAATPSGYKCTQWRNAIAPGDGNHFRPRGGYTGAACASDGTVHAPGLYIPETAPLWDVAIGPTDPTLPAATAGVVPNALFADPTCGYTIIDAGHYVNDVPLWSFGKSDNTNRTMLKDLTNYALIRDPQSGLNYPANINGAASKILLTDCHFVHTLTPDPGATGANFRFDGFDGSALGDGASEAADYLATDREFRLIDTDGGGGVPDGSHLNCGRFFLMFVKGSLSREQITLLRAYVRSRPWATNYWTDTRNWVAIFGDSQEQPLRQFYVDREANTKSIVEHIIQGYKGLQRIPNTCSTVLARSGNRPDLFQSGFSRKCLARDFTSRPKVAFICWEYVNSGSIQQNLDWLSFIKSDYRVIVGTFNTQNNLRNNLGYNHAAFASQFVPSLAKYDIDLLGCIIWDNEFCDSTGTDREGIGANSVHFNANHPRFPESQELLTPKWHIGIRRLLDLDANTLTWEIRPDVPRVTLDSAHPTYTPVWTPLRDDYTVNPSSGAKVFSSRNLAIATVDPATGLITAAGVGETAVDAFDAVGGMGAIAVKVLSVPAVPPDLTTSLLAKWNFNNSLADSVSGLNLTAVGTNPVSYQAGLIGQELVLDGTNYVKIDDTPAIRLFNTGQQGFLVAGWVNPDNFTGSKRYFGKGLEFEVAGTAGNGDVKLAIYDSTLSGSTILLLTFPNGTLVAGTRSFIAVNVNLVTGNCTLTVDGATISGTLSGAWKTSWTAPFTIGADWNGNGKVAGKFDAWRVYNGIKTASDIAALRNGGAGTES